MASTHRPLWTLPPAEVYPALDTAITGSTDLEAQRRLDRFGPNQLPEPAHGAAQRPGATTLSGRNPKRRQRHLHRQTRHHGL